MNVRGVTPGLGFFETQTRRAFARVRFGDSPETPPTPQKTSWWQNTVILTRRVAHKVSNWERFKTSVGNGYQESRADLQAVWNSGSVTHIARRVGAETLGLLAVIICLPLPGPNPGWLVSPTARAFIKGFLKDSPPTEPPAGSKP